MASIQPSLIVDISHDDLHDWRRIHPDFKIQMCAQCHALKSVRRDGVTHYSEYRKGAEWQESAPPCKREGES